MEKERITEIISKEAIEKIEEINKALKIIVDQEKIINKYGYELTVKEPVIDL